MCSWAAGVRTNVSHSGDGPTGAPSAVRVLGVDLDHIPVRQGRGEEGELAVDGRGDAPIADVRTQRVGDVDRGGVGGQQEPVASNEHVHLALGEVAAQ